MAATGLKGSVFISGANGGLGAAFVACFTKSQFAKDYKGIYAVRDPSTAEKLRNVLKEAPKGHQYEVLAMDQSTLANVRKAAAKLNELVSSGTCPPIRAMIMNAATQHVQGQTFTKDGFEIHFGVNYLAQFLFTLLVLKSMDKENGRIISIGSTSHDPNLPGTQGKYTPEEKNSVFNDTEELAYGHFKNEQKDDYPAGMRRYGTSKLLDTMHIYELQRRLQASGTLSNISCLTLDPGWMGDTTLTRESPWFTRVIIMSILRLVGPLVVWLDLKSPVRTAAKSSSDLLWAIFDEDSLGPHPQGLYLDGRNVILSSKESRDATKQKTLWEDSVKLAGVGEGDTVLSNWK